MINIIKREIDRMTKDRDLLVRLVASPNFKYLDPLIHPHPENYFIEIKKLDKEIEYYTKLEELREKFLPFDDL